MLDMIKRFCTGWSSADFSVEDRQRVFDMMYKRGIAFDNEEHIGEDRVRIRLCGVYREYFGHYAGVEGISYTLSVAHGLPAVLDFIKHRPAVALGFLMLFIWMLLSSRIIWDVRVYGAKKTDSDEIITLLDELGCGIGDNFKKIDFNRLNSKYLAMQSDISWITVYMNGTVAEVRVREMLPDERYLPAEGVYANVTAACDGVVESVNVFEGHPCVKPGETVREGQILIAGVVPQKDGSARYEYAAGEVICRTVSSAEVRIDTKREEKRFTGRKKEKNTIKIFKNSINLFVNSGTLYTEYDKIYRVERLCPFGLCELPIWMEKTSYREYEAVQSEISAETAADEAAAELNEKLRALTDGAELISKNVETCFEDGVYIINCVLYLSRDTGITKEFRLTDYTEQIGNNGQTDRGVSGIQ